MKRLVISSIFVALIALTSVAQAEEETKSPLPKDKVGLGVKVNNMNIGGSFAYALQPNFHIGAGVGFSYITGYEVSEGVDIDGGVQMMLSPYFRYIFENIGNLFPYGELNFTFSEIPSAANAAMVDAGTQKSASKSYVNIELGGMWFPFPSVSIRGGVNLINFDIDTSQLGIGIGYPFIGIDWWL